MKSVLLPLFQVALFAVAAWAFFYSVANTKACHGPGRLACVERSL